MCGWRTKLSWNIPEFSKVGRARGKTAVFPVSCAHRSGKVLLQTNGTNGKRTFRRCSFWGHNAPDIRNPKLETQTQEKFRVSQIYFIHPVTLRKKSLFSTVRFFSNPRKIGNCFSGMAVWNWRSSIIAFSYYCSYEMKRLNVYVAFQTYCEIRKGGQFCCCYVANSIIKREHDETKSPRK